MFPVFLSAQAEIAKVVRMSEFVVSAGLSDLDTEDLIKQVTQDSTFYQAFLNLKYYPHNMEGTVQAFYKDDTEWGAMERKAKRLVTDDRMMWVEILQESTNGKIRKRNGEWKFLTVEMYDDVFYPTQKERVSNEIQKMDQELVSGSKLEKHQAQLKRMLFNPGAPIDNVPFIGDKMAIFSDEMVPYYDYSIYAQNWQDTIPCIVFSCFTKTGEEDETVIRNMTSYFHRDTKEVIAREYRLAHSTIFFDFDISIKVENTLIEGELVPVRIEYDGFWDIPFKRPEIIKFDLNCTNYVIN
jgi:hypothetical protein